MTVAAADVPKVLVLEPGRGVRIDLHLDAPACEIEVRLQREAPGRSFVLMIGHGHGEYVQRVRVAGHAKVLFDPESPGDYVLVLTNPMAEAAVVHCEVREVPPVERPRHRHPDHDPAFR